MEEKSPTVSINPIFYAVLEMISEINPEYAAKLAVQKAQSITNKIHQINLTGEISFADCLRIITTIREEF